MSVSVDVYVTYTYQKLYPLDTDLYPSNPGVFASCP